MSKPILVAAAAALLLAQGGRVFAQLPPGVYAGQRDASLAPAGVYAVDASHTAVVAKVSHIGYGLSVFRFDTVDGTLTWDPAQQDHSTLNVSIDTASIDTPVPGFAKELAGDSFLKSTAFPKATFVSTAFHRIDASHGRVDGQFTLMGKTHPLSFDVELEGAGAGFMGHPRLGAEATAEINPQDYGLSPMFSLPIRLVIDAEFTKTN